MDEHLSTGAEFAGYRIEGLAGRGGMGVVYRATQLTLSRPVALKVMAPQFAQDADFRGRFRHESERAASIDHPNVIPVYEAGEEGGLLFIAMRFVDGEDLRQLIAAQVRLAPERAAGIVAQTAAALDAAHARGLVHRDVKPGNVLLAADDHVYLTDFGLTKHTASQSGPTRTGEWVGTVDYVAPEQIEGRSLDARSDVYALGCVLFHSLAGRVPYAKETEVAKMWAHMNDPPPSVAAAVPGLPVEFDPVVRRALAKEPDDRYQSAGDLGRAALAAARGETPAAPERSVAAGAAAPTDPGAAPPTRPAGEAPTEGLTPASAAPPTVARPPAAGPPEPPAPPTTVLPAKRRRLPLVLAGLAVLLLGGAAAVLIATGAFSGKSGTNTVIINRTATGPGQTQASPPPSSVETYRSAAYSVEYPAGWTVAEDSVSKGKFNRTKFVSPDGSRSVAIDETPGVTADPAASAARVEKAVSSSASGYRRLIFEPTTVGSTPAFEWAFAEGADTKVDYFLNAGGNGYAVLGVGPDLQRIQPVAEQIAASLKPL